MPLTTLPTRKQIPKTQFFSLQTIRLASYGVARWHKNTGFTRKSTWQWRC